MISSSIISTTITVIIIIIISTIIVIIIIIKVVIMINIPIGGAHRAEPRSKVRRARLMGSWRLSRNSSKNIQWCK